MGELERSLREIWKGLNKTQDDLHEMHYENVPLTKDYVKVAEFSYSIMEVVFENSLWQVEFSHLKVKISREEIHSEQEMTYERDVILGERPHS